MEKYSGKVKKRGGKVQKVELFEFDKEYKKVIIGVDEAGSIVTGKQIGRASCRERV